MELYQRIDKVNSSDDLADFISALLLDYQVGQSEWENPTLERFLFAMESWVRSIDNYYKNTGRQVSDVPVWQVFADILYASKIYE